MFARNIPVCSTAAEAAEKGIVFGSSEEREWLDNYFRVAGGPVDKPYFMPATKQWVESRYPERSTQRQRAAFQDSIFFHPNRQIWALRSDSALKASERLIKEKDPVPLVALMAWMWRDRKVDSLSDSLKMFIEEVGFTNYDFLGVVYGQDISKSFLAAGLADSPLDQADLAELTGASAPPPAQLSLVETVSKLERYLATAHFQVPHGLVERIVSGWILGDIVVLVGPTGSGKTTLSRLLAGGLAEIYGSDRFFSAFLEVSPEYDVAQFLGYESLGGNFVAGQFSREVLFRGETTDPRLVVLDEWNLAQIDNYLAPLLSATESQMARHFPGRINIEEMSEEDREDIQRAQPDIGEARWRLPVDTFFICTCNSWLDEPETRLPISGPVKRRCRIIQMPNALWEALLTSRDNGLAELADALLEQERSALRGRQKIGRPSVLDQYREERLAAITSFAALPDAASSTLLLLAKIMLENPDTRNSFTPGIFGDLFLSTVYARDGAAYRVLGEQVADKLLHQVQGNPGVLRVIYDNTRDFPNAEEIDSLVRRMGGLGGEQRTRPLV